MFDVIMAYNLKEELLSESFEFKKVLFITKPRIRLTEFTRAISKQSRVKLFNLNESHAI